MRCRFLRGEDDENAQPNDADIEGKLVGAQVDGTLVGAFGAPERSCFSWVYSLDSTNNSARTVPNRSLYLFGGFFSEAQSLPSQKDPIWVGWSGFVKLCLQAATSSWVPNGWNVST